MRFTVNCQEVQIKCQTKDCFNRCSLLLKPVLFSLDVPPLEKKLDSDSNEKESGEYRGVVYTVNGNP